MNKFCSIFSQPLQLFPRYEFQKVVKKTKTERHARGFTCWGQFVAMLFCHPGRAHSLREITGGLRSCEGKLKHLGILAPNRSTLAYANEHRTLSRALSPPHPAGTLAESEARFIEEALVRNSYKRLATARELGIDKTTLWRKIRKLGIKCPAEDPE